VSYKYNKSDLFIFLQYKKTKKRSFLIMNRRIKKITLLLIVMVLSGIIPLKAQLMHPNNLDFEEGKAGKMPRSWILPSYADARKYKAALTETDAKSGKYCLELNRFAPYKDSIYGSVMQSIDAKPYRGKTVKFGAWVKAEIGGPKGSAHLWLIEYTKDNNINYYDLMEDRPIVSNQWTFYEIVAGIDEDAEYINFGLMLKGNGKAWIDGAKFEISDIDEGNYAKPKQLSSQEVENLFVFAKLYGFAKFYNPSSEAFNLDYDKFLLTAIPSVEKAKNERELIDTLNRIFNPVFPAMKIFKNSLPPEEYYYSTKPNESKDNAAFASIHIGAPTIPQSRLAFSRVVNVFNSLRSSEGAVVQLINVEKLRGKEITFSIYAKAETIEPNGRAEIRIGPEDQNETKTYILRHLKILQIKSKKWKRYSLGLKIPDDAVAIRIGLVLTGDGYVRFDNASLKEKGRSSAYAELRNPDFEDDRSEKLAHGWRAIKAAEKAGYTAKIIKNDKKKGKQALEIISEKNNRIPLPEPGEIYLGRLNETIGFSLPYCLYVDDKGTLPHAEGIVAINDKAEFMPKGKDRISRLATLIQAWNMLKHFSLFNNNPGVWDEIFPLAIRKASLDRNNNDFIKTLRLLVKRLNDSHARVWIGGENLYNGLPFLMRWDGEKLVVTKVYSDYKEVSAGDVVDSINGMTTTAYLDEAAKYISGANRNRIYLRAVAELRAGLGITAVRMSFTTKNGEKKSLLVPRSIYLSDLNETRPTYATELKEGIYYIDLTRISDKIFYQLLDSLRSAKGLILDLRGTAMISEHILSFFIKEPVQSVKWEIPVYTKPAFKPVTYKTIQAKIKARGFLANADIVFLQDERTAGYAEAILSVAKENYIGDIIGSRTAGTAGEISSFRLGGNYGFAWTTIKAVNSKGKDIYGEGIEPTITLEELKKSDNELLKTAYELIK
jgi:hypothetical protein